MKIDCPQIPKSELSLWEIPQASPIAVVAGIGGQFIVYIIGGIMLLGASIIFFLRMKTVAKKK